MEVRLGEREQTRFRSERYYRVSGKYYFSTREGVEIGPFETKSELDKAVEHFIEIKGILGCKIESS